MDGQVARMDSHLIQRNVVTDHAAEAVDEARQSDCPWCVAVSVDLVARVWEIKDGSPLRKETEVHVFTTIWSSRRSATVKTDKCAVTTKMKIHTDTDIETHEDTAAHTSRKRAAFISMNWQTHRHNTDTDTHWHRCKQTQRHMKTQTYIHAERELHLYLWTDRQTCRHNTDVDTRWQGCKQTQRNKKAQTYIHAERELNLYLWTGSGGVYAPCI